MIKEERKKTMTKNPTEEIRNELCKHIIKTSTANSNFAYIFAATERVMEPNEVSLATNGDSEQIVKMLATVIQAIATSANVSEQKIMQSVFYELYSNGFERQKIEGD